MNKRVVIFSVLVITIFFAFRFCSNKPEQERVVEPKPAPLTVSQNSAPFNESFSNLLQSYYALKDAFVKGDLKEVNSAAAQLANKAEGLNINEIKGDSSIRETAKYFGSTISASAKTITSEVQPDAQFSEFNTITDAMWSLTRTVKYDQQKIYYHFCPKALDERGGYWLSDTIETNNPYGQKETCSDVTDSLDYSKK